MPLDSLQSLVEKLRERIDAHGSKLRQSEALTRYALIDPLLRELGWDTGDPDLVLPEYREAGGSVDYALFSGKKPLMMVEAKKLDTSLRDEKVLMQGLAYCQTQGTRYLSVTDGRRWEIYETHRAVPINEQRIVEFDLKNGSAAEGCSKALELRRSNIERLPDSPSPPEDPTLKHQPPSPALDEHGWQPISVPSLATKLWSSARNSVSRRFFGQDSWIMEIAISRSHTLARKRQSSRNNPLSHSE